MIYHITTIEDWEQQRHSDSFQEPSLKSEGFIHCSDSKQVTAVANRIFSGRKDLIILSIDESKLSSKVIWENLDSGSEVFPHIYGVIEKKAVLAVNPFDPNADGSFSFNPNSLS